MILVAAGQGSRLGDGPLKQLREIGGVPMVLRALRPFTSHAEVAHVVLVLPAGVAEQPPAWLAELRGGALTLVPGGEERSDSVAAGLGALPTECRTVLVHDAARPFVERATIDAVIARARDGVGAVAAVPLGDTLKEVDAAEGGRIRRTIPRDGLWRAQTPQGFPRAMLERAYAAAPGERARTTDDAMLVERLGETVCVVPDSNRNLKITTADDLMLAERLASRSV